MQKRLLSGQVAHEGRRKLRLLCVCLGLLTLAMGCSIPQAPADKLVWDTHLVLPLGVRTYGLGELAASPEAIREQGSGIGIDTSGLLYFATWTELAVPIRDSLVVDGFNGPIAKPSGTGQASRDFDVPTMEHRLTTGLIHSGTVTVTMGPTSTSETITVTIPNITIDQFGNPLVMTVVTSTTGNTTAQHDLSGDSLNLPDTTPQTVTATISGPTGVTASGQLNVTPLQFNYYRGVVNNLTVQSVDGSTEVEALPDGYEGVHPTTVNAYVHITDGMAATADVMVNMLTRRGGNLVGTANANASDVFLGRDTTIEVRGLSQLLSQYPDFASAHAAITIDGPVESQVTDSLKLDVELRAPLEFTVDPLHAPGDVREVKTDDIKDVQSGSVQLRVWNRLPVGGRAYLLASADSARLANDALAVDTLASIVLPVPPLANGRPTAEAYAETAIEIDDPVLDLFELERFFTRTDVRLDGSGGDTLRAYGADYIKVQAIAEIDYQVGGDDDEGDN